MTTEVKIGELYRLWYQFEGYGTVIIACDPMDCGVVMVVDRDENDPTGCYMILTSEGVVGSIRREFYFLEEINKTDINKSTVVYHR